MVPAQIRAERRGQARKGRGHEKTTSMHRPQYRELIKRRKFSRHSKRREQMKGKIESKHRRGQVSDKDTEQGEDYDREGRRQGQETYKYNDRKQKQPRNRSRHRQGQGADTDKNRAQTLTRIERIHRQEQSADIDKNRAQTLTRTERRHWQEKSTDTDKNRA
jgi:hypothetical protein